MRRVKDIVWLLEWGLIVVLTGMIITTIWAETLLYQRDEARLDANQFFGEAQALRDSLQWHKDQERLRSQEEEDSLNALIQALIMVETEGQVDPEKAIGDSGKAVGVLQIQPCVIEDLRVAGYNYSLGDRYNREKSIEMWLKWMEIWVPDRNPHALVKKHNPRLSWAQHERIIQLMEVIRDGN